ncbi:MAG: HD-GYP domain-containing protein [Candidatus Omnitrophica bacterium]|nr:HD-GYP domain-containing protein [Candidatus Omnitrophota bacterium]
MAKLINRNSIKFKILSIVLFALFLLTFTLGYFSFQFSKNRIIGMLGDSLTGIAASIASFISAEDVYYIVKNSENIKRAATSEYNRPKGLDLLSPRTLDEKPEPPPKEPEINPRAMYDKYSAILQRIKKLNNIDSSITVYLASRNRFWASLTSEPVYLAGTAYVMRQEIKDVLLSGTAQATGIYEDKDGTWISAYAPGTPLLLEDKRVVVEVNYRIDAYIKMLNQELVIIVIICVVGYLMVAFISYQLVTTLVGAIKKLDEAIVDLEQERYDKPIDIKTNDEIGHLAAAFELLRVSIRKKIDELRQSLKREKKAHLESVVALTNAIEERDPYTREHVSRVQEYALLIAKHMHLPHDDLIQLRYSCVLHDIGKIYIENALLKKVNLTHEDFEEIKKHAERGAKIIEGIEFLTDVKEAVLSHQECYDGTGYPRGLKGNEIPLLARIVSVADAFDAMTTDRPYRPKMSFSKAMDEIEKKSGTQFDPEVCAALLAYRDTLEHMAHKRFTEDI